MKKKIIKYLFILLIATPSAGYCFQNNDTTPSSIIAKGASPKLISNRFKFTEGPAVDKYGNVFFTDQPNDQIWKYSTDGKLSLFFEKMGRSNGLYFDKKGNLISCADEKNELWSITPTGKTTVLLSDYKGQLFNGPNDLWIHPNGGIYFTDPLYKRDYWTRQGPRIKKEMVYFLPANKKEAIVVDSSLQKPNGIIGTPDGTLLYVADIQGNKTYKFAINPDGSLQEPQLFIEQGSDGMTIDNKGNIYLTGKGVTVYNAEGKQVEHIDIPAPWTANVCFGGKNRDKLFITASESVYVLDMQVHGVQ
ncbi:SMP-30/gluconolactonase/LRE family protein [Segetibacter koreensis]|uniref:SMP-30/gluconolactonase/LRE family protein n=1 Tax=Segetibacter koreensis TaxID=398037 RepID=UPI00036CD9B8|nr:SMP-30/gluconolactonase/LRE family protein [Segetibacter koreensis]